MLFEIIRLLRIKQWTKNIFVLIPIFFEGNLILESSVLELIMPFLSFCLISSAVYILNDILDLENDRNHSIKKLRPLASGKISIKSALFLLSLLIVITISILSFGLISINLSATILIYFIINVLYSFKLKNIPVLEMFMVSSGFVLRLIGGGLNFNIILSPWIIICTASLSLLLVVGKRCSDLFEVKDKSSKRIVFKYYSAEYLKSLTIIISSVTLLVYLNFCLSNYAQTKYSSEYILITAIPVFYGIFRYLNILFLSGKGSSPDELLFDREIFISVLTFILSFLLIIYFN